MGTSARDCFVRPHSALKVLWFGAFVLFFVRVAAGALSLTFLRRCLDCHGGGGNPRFVAGWLNMEPFSGCTGTVFCLYG